VNTSERSVKLETFTRTGWICHASQWWDGCGTAPNKPGNRSEACASLSLPLQSSCWSRPEHYENLSASAFDV